jgi:ADP-dependent NAD(P)H-hydrate dehydratase / NAD(P)H-hydrate epimerase
MRVVLPREMAQIDRAAIEDEKIPGMELMERAGEAVARAARDMITATGGRRVGVVCGKGNNGGDGLVAARRLAGAFEAVVFMVGAEKRTDLSPDARANYDRLEGTPVTVRWICGPGDASELIRDGATFDLLIDCLFGTGFRGPAEGMYETVIEAMNDAARPVLSADIPSGVAGDTGAVDGRAVVADRTVTFAAPKAGLVQFPGAGYVGEMEVVDIGIPERLIETVPTSKIFLTTEEDAEALLPQREPDAHKGSCGSVLVVGGSPGLTGAAAMCSRAALRCGAGLVTLAVPEGLSDIMEIKLTEVMTLSVPQTSGRTFSESAAAALLEAASGSSVVALGPGISRNEETAGLVRNLLASIEAPLVLDADGLNALIGRTGLVSDRKNALVMTPHPGEMARLIGADAKAVQADRIGAASRAAAEWGAVVVLKGAGTVIAEPGGDVCVNPTGNAGMATAGTGDVLTGCIAAFLAQGLDPFGAAVAGAYFHGLAGDLSAQMEGMTGMTAGDLIRNLPLALRRLSEERWL